MTKPKRYRSGRQQGSRTVCGLMSGTSLDGIDAVIVRISGTGSRTRLRQLASVSRPYPVAVRNMIAKNSTGPTNDVGEIARLNVFLAELYADTVRAAVRKGRMQLRDLDLIGLHGQTIAHLPAPRRFLGRPIRATLQIGDPSVLANLTGVTTVGDFRVADMAVGGQGAPLVPYVDWILFRHRSRNRILLNIGGIANMTILPAGCPPEKVIAFDTGPGNMVVDALMQKFYRRSFDRNGQVAFRGDVQLMLLRRLLAHPFFRKRPPKSTGREEFGQTFVREMFGHVRTSQKEDAVATASFLTPLSVHNAYRRFPGRRMIVDELIVSGGGARNLYFLRVLEYLFGSGVVKTSDEFGISPSAKEAICFAVLANETIAGNRANLPSVTGARRAVILGKVCQGDNKPASG